MEIGSLVKGFTPAAVCLSLAYIWIYVFEYLRGFTIPAGTEGVIHVRVACHYNLYIRRKL